MREEIFLAFLVALLFLSGCITPEKQKVEGLPEVKAFLEKHPDAVIEVRFIRLALLTKAEAGDFKEKCGMEASGGGFYYARVVSQNESMEIWLDEKDMEPLCIYGAGIATRLCRSNADCDDRDNATTDECVLGECTHRLKTCKESGGKICKKDWFCTEDFVSTYDTENCCFGACIESLCDIIECGAGEKCVGGECILLTCKELDGTVCPAMQKCNGAVIQSADSNLCCVPPAKCVQINPCSEVRCPEGMRCMEGTCVYI